MAEKQQDYNVFILRVYLVFHRKRLDNFIIRIGDISWPFDENTVINYSF